jgi:hypothetical protein
MRSSSKFVELGLSTPVAVAWITVVGVIVTAICGVLPALINRPTPDAVVQPIKDTAQLREKRQQYADVVDPSVDNQRQAVRQFQERLNKQAKEREIQLQNDMINDPTTH